jgi:hypothetical protein
MKKQIIVSLALICGFQMSLAAPVRNVESVRRAVVEEMARVKSETRVNDQMQISRSSDTLSRISGASSVELKAALARKIKIKEVDGEREVSLLEIGNLLSAADQSIRTKDLTNLDAAGRAHLEATQEAIKVSSEFLSLANRTTEMTGVMSDQQKLEVAAFNKQVSLIPEMITKMDTSDLKAHTDAMKKAIAKRTGPSINGDQAFALALKEGKSQEDYIQKLNELTSCIR